uniref:NAD(P)H-hydrate epimerase n=1 Tax=Plectus sambesii TaxID=2011161 RepID=A0A914WFZ0_9BILA
MTSTSGTAPSSVKLLGQEEAIEIDKELFSEYQFSVDQLMELAGLSCAQVIERVYPVEQLPNKGAVLVVCGPGNNGGDGLVCARHLSMFGYYPSVFYPKRSSSELMKRLVTQTEALDIPYLSYLPDAQQISHSFGLIVDAIFGFSFKPPIREPFDDVLHKLQQVKSPVACIDIPSGWDVETGPPKSGAAVIPDCLISLTAPKKCAVHFRGRHHFLGGRFIPSTLAQKYELNLPDFPGSD